MYRDAFHLLKESGADKIGSEKDYFTREQLLDDRAVIELGPADAAEIVILFPDYGDLEDIYSETLCVAQIDRFSPAIGGAFVGRRCSLLVITGVRTGSARLNASPVWTQELSDPAGGFSNAVWTHPRSWTEVANNAVGLIPSDYHREILAVNGASGGSQRPTSFLIRANGAHFLRIRTAFGAQGAVGATFFRRVKGPEASRGRIQT